MNIQLDSRLQSLTSASSTNSSQSASGIDFAAFSQELTSLLDSALTKYGIPASDVKVSVTPSASSLSNPLFDSSRNVASTTAGGSASRASDAGTTDTTDMSFNDAYWAKQPAAVQALRDIQDPTERSTAAANLMAQGYQIDVPIMMWGWDPQITMGLRQDYGYTWVPSAEQASVQQAPGLSVMNLQAYDPNSAPAGSIQVG